MQDDLSMLSTLKLFQHVTDIFELLGHSGIAGRWGGSGGLEERERDDGG
uniref:Uncharacterized protein n=1 Tax=Moniliophthora roreri TaxID=221103 RepID=A0A0W0G227_MONRR